MRGRAVPPPASWAVYAEHRRRARCGRSQSVRSIVHGQRRTVKGTMSIIYIKGNANKALGRTLARPLSNACVLGEDTGEWWGDAYVQSARLPRRPGVARRGGGREFRVDGALLSRQRGARGRVGAGAGAWSTRVISPSRRGRSRRRRVSPRGLARFLLRVRGWLGYSRRPPAPRARAS